ncbi:MULTISPECIES: leucyl aminopeptidase [unclassified Herbaspirillum]|uniref:leucyl aminopeptidase n=1 Tax=unclassified Herbaspirillum TaxID=2624150 RepID=UPI000E2F1FBD|nr:MULTISPECIES: leucyl aminopeptidase [unclassified Herbaspirillum]RFB73734.1 leucyl aminopeptidase [Herbaspirillum sp. 3R-3a1]TFI10459.1 leucyl aminopeptidase [Herbaspirillum sp. 3R11]TFI16364.1 leucyl aminopeptidase [Herbaspirillum sp. 3R-11]TFI24911.1 leucyl aminopeptidase [Herbaspirillum sp. 3C11]
MDFSIKTLDAKTSVNTAKTGVLVVGVFENRKLTQAAQALDKSGAISDALKSGDITGKPGSTLLLRGLAGVAAERVLLVGLGADEEIIDKSFSSATQGAVRALTTVGAADALVALPLDQIKGRDAAWAIRALVLAARDNNYRSDVLKSKKDPAPTGVKKIAVAVSTAATAAAKTGLAEAVALANGMELSKDLANLPGNVCTPTYLANSAKKLAKEYKLGVEVLDRKQLEALKMGSFLSVTNGSDEPPKFIVLKHLGGKSKDAPIVLVGKGITFDTGGISLKPGAGMDEMKYDMCGAASVLGTFRAIAELQLKLNVIGVIPTCENMPSGRATKPGDIVTSMSGQTIEVLNTDAEGRLILCDALTYVERFKPAAVVDIATLTGACVVALGHHNTGLFTREDDAHDQLANDLLAAGKSSGDTAWRMPVQDVYQEQLKSNFADIANIGGQPGGSVTAACFLERFTKKYTWAHLDIAGTAWRGGATKGASGRPVPLLTTFLLNEAKKSQKARA